MNKYLLQRLVGAVFFPNRGPGHNCLQCNPAEVQKYFTVTLPIFGRPADAEVCSGPSFYRDVWDVLLKSESYIQAPARNLRSSCVGKSAVSAKGLPIDGRPFLQGRFTPCCLTQLVSGRSQISSTNKMDLLKLLILPDRLDLGGVRFGNYTVHAGPNVSQ